MGAAVMAAVSQPALLTSTLRRRARPVSDALRRELAGATGRSITRVTSDAARQPASHAKPHQEFGPLLNWTLSTSSLAVFRLRATSDSGIGSGVSAPQPATVGSMLIPALTGYSKFCSA